MAFTIRPDINQEKIITKVKSITGELTSAGALLESARIVSEDLPDLKIKLSRITAERNKLYNAITDICNNYKLYITTENKLHELIINIAKTINPKS